MCLVNNFTSQGTRGMCWDMSSDKVVFPDVLTKGYYFIVNPYTILPTRPLHKPIYPQQRVSGYKFILTWLLKTSNYVSVWTTNGHTDRENDRICQWGLFVYTNFFNKKKDVTTINLIPPSPSACNPQRWKQPRTQCATLGRWGCFLSRQFVSTEAFFSVLNLKTKQQYTQCRWKILCCKYKLQKLYFFGILYGDIFYSYKHDAIQTKCEPKSSSCARFAPATKCDDVLWEHLLLLLQLQITNTWSFSDTSWSLTVTPLKA